jgi:hypothetical protein
MILDFVSSLRSGWAPISHIDDFVGIGVVKAGVIKLVGVGAMQNPERSRDLFPFGV